MAGDCAISFAAPAISAPTVAVDSLRAVLLPRLLTARDPTFYSVGDGVGLGLGLGVGLGVAVGDGVGVAGGPGSVQPRGGPLTPALPAKDQTLSLPPMRTRCSVNRCAVHCSVPALVDTASRKPAAATSEATEELRAPYGYAKSRTGWPSRFCSDARDTWISAAAAADDSAVR